MELYKMLVGFVGLSLDFSGGFSKTLDFGHCLDPISSPSFFHRVVMASPVLWYQLKWCLRSHLNRG